MANSERESSSSDEEIPKVKKRRCLKHSFVSSSSDSDSDVQICAKRKKRVARITESDPDSSSSSSSGISKRRMTKNNRKKYNALNESSDNEQSEKCSICLSKFLGQEIASPEACDHIFCTECLLEWGKKMNTCPIDRTRFRYVRVRSSDGPDGFGKYIPVEHQSYFHFGGIDDLILDVCIICRTPGNLRSCTRCHNFFHSNCMFAFSEEPNNDERLICVTCRRFTDESSIGNLLSSRVNTRWLTSVRHLLRYFWEQQVEQRALNNVSLSSGTESLTTSRLNTISRLQQRDAVRRRREKRNPEAIRDRIFSSLRTDAVHYTAPSPNVRSHPLYTINDSSDDSDYSYEESQGVLTRNRQRSVTRSKRFIPLSTLNRPSPRNYQRIPNMNDHRMERVQVSIPSSEGTFFNAMRNAIGRQQPMNPVQTTTAGSTTTNSHSTLPSSSSSATSGSSHHDLYNIPGCSILANNTSVQGHDADTSSSVIHNIYSNEHEDFKDDTRNSLRAKDIRKSHSDDEVDIYGDIQYANDDDVNLDTEMDSVRSCMEPPCHLPTSEALDSSDDDDNDLVIDEDMPVEEDIRNFVDSECPNDLNRIIAESESSALSSVENNDDLVNESEIPETIQSPDPVENNNQENDAHWLEIHESEGSSEIVTAKTPVYIDSDVESKDAEDIIHEDQNLRTSFDLDLPSQSPESLVDAKNIFMENPSPVSDERISNHNLTEDIQSMSLEREQNISTPKIESDDESSREAMIEENKNDQILGEIKEFSNDKVETEDDIESDKEQCVNSEDKSVNNDSDDKFLMMEESNEHFILEENDYAKSSENDCNNHEDSRQMDSIDDDNKYFETEDVKSLNEEEKSEEHSDINDNEQINSDIKKDEIINENGDQIFQEDNNDDLSDNNFVNENDNSPRNMLRHELSNDDRSNNFMNSKPYIHNANSYFAESRPSGLREFPTKASLKECLPLEGEFNLQGPLNAKNAFQNIDLGIEDISDAASDELNQLANETPEPMECDNESAIRNVEKNVAKLFDSDNKNPIKSSRKQKKGDYSDETHDDSKREPSISDQEEGEIIEDIPYHRKSKSRRRDHFIDEDEYIDSTPRVNISSLPRIPKIKRESKIDIIEEPPLESKRTSVLGRVDLGSSDIGWKRLSKHTKERSYRDGRPKDETLLFRERELKSKNKNKKHTSKEGRSDEKLSESDRKKNDDKKYERDRSRDKNEHSYERRSDRSRSEYEKSSKSDWSYSEKKDRDKHSKHKDKHDRDKSKKSKHESKRDKHEKTKEKSSRRDESRHEREKLRSDDKYIRDDDRFHKEDSYDRLYEKSREKEHKHKHRDKSDGGKKCKEDKHKRTHSREHHSDKKEREVRKVDDKLKIVVEHKDSRNKDKSDKSSDKRDSKHEKKHREVIHHQEHKKKEIRDVDYADYPSIESKEIFAKGDSIIINVNFNRETAREVVALSDDEHDQKSGSIELSKSDNNVASMESQNSKLLHLSDSEKKSDHKRPSTPVEKTVSDCYWRDNTDASSKSPITEKVSIEKIHALDNSSHSPINNFGGDDHMTDSEDEKNLSESQPLISQSPDEGPGTPVADEKEPDCYPDKLESESYNSRRRSPIHPPSPPSPPDNDSYDPCEPTKSPSPLPSPSNPPLPVTNLSDRPKPPPSPVLPPLPPEPEPLEVSQDDGHTSKLHLKASDGINTSATTPVISQDHNAPLANETAVSSPGVLQPPPRFMGHLGSHKDSKAKPQVQKSMNWQSQSGPPPPPPLIFPANHMQPVIQGNFLASHLQAVSFPPPHVSAAVLPQNNSIPLTTEVRHVQLGPPAVMPSNTLPSALLNHLNLPQVQIVNPPLTNSSVSVTIPQHQTLSIQEHLQNTIPGLSLISNIGVSQHGNLVALQHPQNVVQHSVDVSQLFPSQGQTTLPDTQKSEKLLKNSPNKDKTEVIDMDVDSPYSPGDSPSMDSAYDYSPPNSPVHKDVSTPTSAVKDAFDSLFSPGLASSTQTYKNNRSNTNSAEKESKRQKLDKTDKNRHHSIRLHVHDKAKSKKERKISERKEFLSKFDESQLTILDELPSSAVEMQVKEKFLKKLNRQERVIEEVKMALKPYYKTKEIGKEEYKDILRKSVPKICHNKSGEINPLKVKSFIDSYVKKMKHHRKKLSKKHKSSKFS